MKKKTKCAVIGRPKVDTEKVQIRWPKTVATWLRRKGSKEKVIKIAWKEIDEK